MSACHETLSKPFAGEASATWEWRQSSSNQDTEGDTKEDTVERKAKTHAHCNAHADGSLTFLALGQVGPPIQSSTTLKVSTTILPLAGRRCNREASV